MKTSIKRMRMGTLVLSVSIFAALILASCSKSDNEGTVIPSSGVMAFNLAVNEPAAAFSIDRRDLTVAPLPYSSFTGSYLGIFPGTRQVEVYNYSTTNSLTFGNFNFEASGYYSWFLLSTDTSYQQVIVRDNIDSLTANGQAYVRYINGIPDANSLNVTVTANGTAAISDNAPFASISDFKPVAAGDIAINVTNGGSVNVNRNITVEANKVYTILLSGKPGALDSSAPQVKFILNGTIDDTATRTTTSSARAAN